MPGGMPTGGGPPGTQGADASAAGTTGTVAYTKGDTLYVKDAEGNTIKVKVKSSAKVSRTASTDADDVQPGDSVVDPGRGEHQGHRHGDGDHGHRGRPVESSSVRVLLNLIWLVFGGIWLALGYAVAALVMFILIITIPFGIAAGADGAVLPVAVRADDRQEAGRRGRDR